MSEQIQTEQPVVVERAGAVATVRLNRPDQMNGLTIATKELLRDHLADLGRDDSVRCVVLTGSGRAFCVGQDLKEHVAVLKDPAQRERLFTTVPEHYNPIVTSLATMPKPVIAAINGVAAGAGASLAFACDLRLMADTAGFNLAFPGIALSCDTGASWTLPRLVGRAKALELLYFPSTIPAEEALRLGLATRVVPGDELADQAAALAESLAAGPTLSYASIRASVNHASGVGFADALAFEAEKMALTGSSQDHERAVDAFLSKQTPQFDGH